MSSTERFFNMFSKSDSTISLPETISLVSFPMWPNQVCLVRIIFFTILFCGKFIPKSWKEMPWPSLNIFAIRTHNRQTRARFKVMRLPKPVPVYGSFFISWVILSSSLHISDSAFSAGRHSISITCCSASKWLRSVTFFILENYTGGCLSLRIASKSTSSSISGKTPKSCINLSFVASIEHGELSYSSFEIW